MTGVQTCALPILFAWNESSRRYVTEEPEFYLPAVWRSAPENKKQGSGRDLDYTQGMLLSMALTAHFRAGRELYECAIAQGIAPEQARLFLPAYALYIRWRWTCSLQGVLHFLSQRLAPDAQWETRQYAQAVLQFVTARFPKAVEAWGLEDK